MENATYIHSFPDYEEGKRLSSDTPTLHTNLETPAATRVGLPRFSSGAAALTCAKPPWQ